VGSLIPPICRFVAVFSARVYAVHYSSRVLMKSSIVPMHVGIRGELK
jgi:hypothetical protein